MNTRSMPHFATCRSSLKIESGFSLIEAIVSLVILSIVFTTVWGWFGTAVVSTERIRSTIGLPETVNEFLRRIELEDLSQIQSGDMEIGEYTVQWRAEVARRSDESSYRRQPAWVIALFNVDAKIYLNQKLITTMETQSVRYWADPNYIDIDAFRPGF